MIRDVQILQKEENSLLTQLTVLKVSLFNNPDVDRLLTLLYCFDYQQQISYMEMENYELKMLLQAKKEQCNMQNG